MKYEESMAEQLKFRDIKTKCEKYEERRYRSIRVPFCIMTSAHGRERTAGGQEELPQSIRACPK